MSDEDEIINRLRRLGAKIHLTSDPDSDHDTEFNTQFKKDKQKLISQALLNTYLIKTDEEILKEHTPGLNKYLKLFHKELCNVIREIRNPDLSNKLVFADLFEDIPKKMKPNEKSKLISDEIIEFFKLDQNLFNVKMPFRSDESVSLHFPLVDENNNRFYQCFEKAMKLELPKNKQDDNGLLGRIRTLHLHVNKIGRESEVIMSISDRLIQNAEIRGEERSARVSGAAASQGLSEAMGDVADKAIDAEVQVSPAMHTLAAVAGNRSNPGPRTSRKRRSSGSTSCWSCGSRPDKAGGKKKKKKKRRRTNHKKIRQTKHKQYKKTKRYKKKSKSR